MSKQEWGVHKTHCCVLHGCKYGEEDCPVEKGLTKQKYTCESCDFHGIHSLEDIEEYQSLQKKLVEAKEKGQEEIVISTRLLEWLLS